MFDITFVIKHYTAHYDLSTDAFIGMSATVVESHSTYEEAVDAIFNADMTWEDYYDVTMLVTWEHNDVNYCLERPISDLHVRSYYTDPSERPF